MPTFIDRQGRPFPYLRLWEANDQSSGDWRLEQTSTVPCPVIFGEVATRR